MQGLAMFGLIIVTVAIYCSSTLLIAAIINAVEDGDDESFAFFAWVTGCVLFVIVVMFWATRPFPISIG